MIDEASPTAVLQLCYSCTVPTSRYVQGSSYIVARIIGRSSVSVRGSAVESYYCTTRILLLVLVLK